MSGRWLVLLAVAIDVCVRSGSVQAAYADPSWSTMAAMPTVRYRLAAAAVNGTLYAIGGWNSGGSLGTVESYDPTTNSWSAKSLMPSPRSYLAAATVGGTIYAVGGYYTGASGIIEAYDTKTNSWTAFLATMPTARSSLASAALGGTIYAIGGGNGGGLATVEAYYPATNTWATKSSLPSPRSGLAAVAVGGTIYAIGGLFGVPLATVHAYDPATNTWSARASMPTPRFGLTAVVSGGTIYAIGGHNNSVYLSTVEAYDPRTNTWTTKANMPTARLELAGASVGGTIFAVGGSDGTFLGTTEAGSPSASLSAIARILPSVPSGGQWMTVQLTVTNTGRADAIGVIPALQLNGGAGLVDSQGGAVPAGPVTIPSGGATTFIWTYSVSGAGTVSLTATASGTSAGTGAPIEASANAAVATLARAAFATALTVTSSPVAVGGWVRLALTVTNTGGVAATGASAALQFDMGGGLVIWQGGPTPAGPLTLVPGGSTTFIWTYSTSGAGIIGFTATASGTDGGTGQTVAAFQTGQVSAVAVARLEAAATVPSSPVFVGRWVQVSLTVTNTGGASATTLSPSLQIDGGGATVSPVGGASPSGLLLLPPGAATTFVWTYSVSGAGTVALTASVMGIDAGMGGMLLAAASGTFSSLQPATLVSGLLVPNPQVTVGQVALVHLTVLNAGGVTATGVVVAMEISGGSGLVSSISGPLPVGPVTLGPGTATVFEWRYSAVGAGNVSFSATATGMDGLTGLQIFSATGGMMTTLPAASAVPLAGARAHVAYGHILAAPNVQPTGQAVEVILHAHGDPSAHVELTIFDAGGSRVGTLQVALDGAGFGQASVAGGNIGRRLGPGIYDVVARGGGVTARTSFAVVRPR